MTVTEAIQARRSVRAFLDKPVEAEKLEAVLEAGRLAPSARNRQEWLFYAVTDKETRNALEPACAGQKQVSQAPVVLVVCSTADRMMMCGQSAATVDCSIAFSFMMLEAEEQGLSTCWLGSFHAEEVQKALGLPSDVVPVVVSPLGYADEAPEARPRKGMAEVICKK